MSNEPVARVMGYHGGRCVIEPLKPSAVLPVGIALYIHPADDTALLRQALEALRVLYTPKQPSAKDFDLGFAAIMALRERLGEET
jgi:hypothetical protein